jgi:hypothetical protein
MRYPDDIRYFALLRAIIMRHQDIVRWLIDELGVNVSEDLELTHPQVYPVDLAIYAGRKGMVELLLERHADASLAACAWRCVDCWKVAA